MTETRYQLIFCGRLQPGTRPEDARQALKQRFRLTDPQLDRLFSGKPATVKRNLDCTNAERYQRAFLAAGALTELEPVMAPVERTSSPRASAALAAETAVLPLPRNEDNVTAPPSTASSAQDTTSKTTSEDDELEAMQLLPPGSPIGEQPAAPEAPPPDISHLRLAPSEASSLEDCAPPPPTPPALDLSSLELLPLDPSQQRK